MIEGTRIKVVGPWCESFGIPLGAKGTIIRLLEFSTLPTERSLLLLAEIDGFPGPANGSWYFGYGDIIPISPLELLAEAAELP